MTQGLQGPIDPSDYRRTYVEPTPPYLLVDPTDPSRTLVYEEARIAPWLRPSYKQHLTAQARQYGRHDERLPWTHDFRVVFGETLVIIELKCHGCGMFHSHAFAPTRPEWEQRTVARADFDTLSPDQQELARALVEDALLADQMLD